MLFQKTTKELLSFITKQQFPPHWRGSSDLSGQTHRVSGASADQLLTLLVDREKALFLELGTSMQKSMGEGKSMYEVWNREQSDGVQACAQAFGDSFALASFLQVTQRKDVKADPASSQILNDLCRLFALRCDLVLWLG